MAYEWAVRATPFVLFDGTNAAEILAAAVEYRGGTVTIDDSTPGVAELRISFADIGTEVYTINTGDRYGPTTSDVLTPTQWAERFVKVTP